MIQVLKKRAVSKRQLFLLIALLRVGVSSNRDGETKFHF
jgi:hypothetical protein